MLYSNVNGSNNDSGMIYKAFNGMAQYKVSPMFPIWSNPQAKYVNEKNENGLLETMNDEGEGMDINKKGHERPKDIPNEDIQDGGFKNVGKVVEQTKLQILPSSNAGRLATGDIVGLTTTPSQPPRGDVKEMKTFDRFLSSVNVNKFGNKQYVKPRKRFMTQKESVRKSLYSVPE